MGVNKVEICGVQTSQLKTLTEKEMTELHRGQHFVKSFLQAYIPPLSGTFPFPLEKGLYMKVLFLRKFNFKERTDYSLERCSKSYMLSSMGL